jgi:hypothetical protein
MTQFTQGGFIKHHYSRDPNVSEVVDMFDRQMNKDREGYYAWMGLGGSTMQWNPELNVGFAYVTWELL